jgi:twitching motility protein PilT
MTGREYDASDIHLTVGMPPRFRIDGELVLVEEYRDTLIPNRTILSMLNARQEERLHEGEDLDFVIELENECRQRVNVFRQMGKLACTIRLLNSKIRTLEELKLPSVLGELALKKNGLVLVTGATGVNMNRKTHIITIEDPIEYAHKHKKSIIHQREVGSDTTGFAAALRSALREDPDVILVGEMRDLETISAAITAAETGHLVLSTLHTSGAASTIDRIIDVFPTGGQSQIRTQLAAALRGIISQQLLKKADGSGRTPAFEILVANDAISNLIREAKGHQINSMIQSGQKEGMQLLDNHLAKMVKAGIITKESALAACANKDVFLDFL